MKPIELSELEIETFLIKCLGRQAQKRVEAEAAYAVAQREEKAVWGKADRTWAAWEAVVRKNK
jgi:hypothetical protein